MKLPEKLIHSAESFSYEDMENRREKYGFNNLSRMELFLWDLEIFLQIQQILKDKIVLKGGAASQFYLPIHHQRSSVDIDMLCTATKDEIDNAISIIQDRFKANEQYYTFKLYSPKNPKTDLPLFTYYMDVPSQVPTTRIDKNQSAPQEVKIEFLLSEDIIEINKISAPELFAMPTQETYNILPIDYLLADKFTTLGPNTIGIQNERSDEQIKQIYDIYSLIYFNIDSLNFQRIKQYYLKVAKLQAEMRDIPFDIDLIYGDVENQLEELSSIDISINKEYKKRIVDFQSLYLRRSINRPISEWAIVGLSLKFIFHLFTTDDEKIKEKIKQILNIESKLGFSHIEGPEKGKQIHIFKELLLKKYEDYSKVPIIQLKGKNQKRIFWEVITPENADDLISWIEKYFTDIN